MVLLCAKGPRSGGTGTRVAEVLCHPDQGSLGSLVKGNMQVGFTLLMCRMLNTLEVSG